MTEARTKLWEEAMNNLGRAIGASIYANLELQSPLFDYETWKRAQDESTKYGLTALAQGFLLFATQPPRRNYRRRPIPRVTRKQIC